MTGSGDCLVHLMTNDKDSKLNGNSSVAAAVLGSIVAASSSATYLHIQKVFLDTDIVTTLCHFPLQPETTQSPSPN